MTNPNFYNVSRGDTAVIDLDGRLTRLPIVDLTPYVIVAYAEKDTMFLSYEESIICKENCRKLLIGWRVLDRICNQGFGGIRLVR